MQKKSVKTIVMNIVNNEYVFSVVARLITVAIGMIHSVVMARFLGTEYKGVASVIQSYIGVIGIILIFGLNEAYPYYKRRNDDDSFKDRYISFLIILFSIYLFVSFMIALLFSHINYELSIAIVIAPINAYATIVSYIYLIDYPKRRNFALIVISILETLFILLLMFTSVANIFLVSCIVAFADIIKSVFFTIKLEFRFAPRLINKNFIAKMARFGLFPMIAAVLTNLNYKIDVLMLNSLDYISFSQIGIYSVGVALADKTVYIPDAVREILLSKLAKGSNDEEVAKAIRLCFPIALMVTVFLFIFGRPIIDLLYGIDYSGSYSVTVICVLGTSFMTFFKMISQWNIVNKRQIVNVVLLSVSVCVNIVLNLVLIPMYSIIGAAIASVIGYLICAAMFVVYFHFRSGIMYRDIIFPTKTDIQNIWSIINKKNVN